MWECARCGRSFAQQSQVHTYTFRLTAPAEVDAQFVGWLAEAYRVGCQRHLTR
jgi:endogenous inhibitor of DNA gyrase (YacG/DUF329 family)